MLKIKSYTIEPSNALQLGTNSILLFCSFHLFEIGVTDEKMFLNPSEYLNYTRHFEVDYVECDLTITIHPAEMYSSFSSANYEFAAHLLLLLSHWTRMPFYARKDLATLMEF